MTFTSGSVEQAALTDRGALSGSAPTDITVSEDRRWLAVIYSAQSSG